MSARRRSELRSRLAGTRGSYPRDVQQGWTRATLLISGIKHYGSFTVS